MWIRDRDRPCGSRRWPAGVDDDGQAVGLVVVMLLAVVLALGLVVLSAQLAMGSARAQTAADAAALAGAVEGRGAAERLADANGARLVAWSQFADEVSVRVAVGSVEASATAETWRASRG